MARRVDHVVGPKVGRADGDWYEWEGFQYAMLIPRYHRYRAIQQLKVSPTIGELRAWIVEHGSIGDECGEYAVVDHGTYYDLEKIDRSELYECFWRSMLLNDVEDGEENAMAGFLDKRLGSDSFLECFSRDDDDFVEPAVESLGCAVEKLVFTKEEDLSESGEELVISKGISEDLVLKVLRYYSCEYSMDIAEKEVCSELMVLVDKACGSSGFEIYTGVEPDFTDRYIPKPVDAGFCYLALFDRRSWFLIASVLGRYPSGHMVAGFLVLAKLYGYQDQWKYRWSLSGGVIHLERKVVGAPVLDRNCLLRKMLQPGIVVGGRAPLRLLDGPDIYTFQSLEYVPGKVSYEAKYDGTCLNYGTSRDNVVWYKAGLAHALGNYAGFIIYNFPKDAYVRHGGLCCKFSQGRSVVATPGMTFQFGFVKGKGGVGGRWNAVSSTTDNVYSCPDTCVYNAQFITPDHVGFGFSCDSISRFTSRFANMHVVSDMDVDGDFVDFSVVDIHSELDFSRAYDKRRVEVACAGVVKVKFPVTASVIVLYALNPSGAELECAGAVMSYTGGLAVMPNVEGCVEVTVRGVDMDRVDFRYRSLYDDYAFDGGGLSDGDEEFEKVMAIPEV